MSQIHKEEHIYSVKRIKTFALFEAAVNYSNVASHTALEIKDIFEPYVSFPELYRDNFMTWHFITQGWNNYDSYVDYVKPDQPLSPDEFEVYRKAWWSSPLFVGGNHLFNQLLGCILRAQIVKLESNQWDFHDWDTEKMTREFKRPRTICEILYALLHGSFKGPEWTRID